MPSKKAGKPLLDAELDSCESMRDLEAAVAARQA